MSLFVRHVLLFQGIIWPPDKGLYGGRDPQSHRTGRKFHLDEERWGPRGSEF